MSKLEFTCDGIKVREVYAYECYSCGKKRTTMKKPEKRMMCLTCRKQLVNENQSSLLVLEKELNLHNIKIKN